MPAKAPVVVNVKFANQGDNVQKNVVVTVKLTAPGPGRDQRQEAGDRDAARHRVGRRDPAAEGARRGHRRDPGRPVEPVGGEKNTDNNQGTYTVLFAN